MVRRKMKLQVVVEPQTPHRSLCLTSPGEPLQRVRQSNTDTPEDEWVTKEQTSKLFIGVAMVTLYTGLCYLRG